jgi:hypothetical protein
MLLPKQKIRKMQHARINVVVWFCFLIATKFAHALSPLPKFTIRHFTEEGNRYRAKDKGVGVNRRRRAAAGVSVGDASDISRLSVRFPSGLTQTYAHADALFGIPAWGGTTTGILAYPPGDITACSGAAGLGSIPRGSVVLLQRGNCSFGTKALAAQEAGAVGVLVIDNRFLCGVDRIQCGLNQCFECPYYEVDDLCACNLQFMADDGGNAGSVIIPSFLIGRTDGDELLRWAVPKASGGGAVASLSWDLPNVEGASEYSMWHTADDRFARQWREGFEPYVQPLGSDATFIPRYFLWDGEEIGCGVIYDCGSQCVNNDLYCSVDPDGDLDSGVTGADVVREALRQMCIYETTNGTWWQYTRFFSFHCFGGNEAAGPGDPFSSECSEAQMVKAGIDVGKVRDCLRSSNSSVNERIGDYRNKLLERELQDIKALSLVTLPSFLVEDVMLRGGSSPLNVLAALCASFGNRNAIPKVCGCMTVPADQLQQCLSPMNSASSASGMPMWAAATVGVVAVGLIGTLAAVYYFHRKTKEDVGAALDDYRALITEVEPDVGSQSKNDSKTVGVPGRRLPSQAWVARRLKMLANSVRSPAQASRLVDGVDDDAAIEVTFPSSPRT